MSSLEGATFTPVHNSRSIWVEEVAWAEVGNQHEVHVEGVPVQAIDGEGALRGPPRYQGSDRHGDRRGPSVSDVFTFFRTL